jgi:peptidoglycan/LPS O-acetylase OafA/YrhL
MTLDQLTFLRFIAAMGVVIFHFRNGASSLDWGVPLWRQANVAVSFFFTLSGFILACVYQDRGIRRVADFYVARLARIYPLYALALLFIAAFQLYKHVLKAGELALSTVLLQSWTPGYSQVLNEPGWSLSVELFFYLCFPFLLRRMAPMRSRTLLAVSGGAWLLTQSVYIALCASGQVGASARLADFVTFGPAFHLSTFLMGLGGGLLFVRHRKRLRVAAVPLMLASVGIFFAFVLVPNPIIHFHHDGLFAPLFVCFLWGLGAAPDLAVSRLLARPGFVLLGEASYGIYLLQGPVALVHAFITSRMAVSTNAKFWSYALALTLISIACFRWFEVPLRQRLKASHERWAVRPRPSTLLPS